MVGLTAHRLMALEVEELTGTAPGKRSPERINQCNGYRERTWETRARTIELRIPKRLEKDHFCWPRIGHTRVYLNGTQLLALVDGLDWTKVRPLDVTRRTHPASRCRCRFRAEYTASTLREHLGLAVPS